RQVLHPRFKVQHPHPTQRRSHTRNQQHPWAQAHTWKTTWHGSTDSTCPTYTTVDCGTIWGSVRHDGSPPRDERLIDQSRCLPWPSHLPSDERRSRCRLWTLAY
ncbi:hypothetical protein M9458_016084, partial [Cirrhinus mrigala]